MSKKIQIKARKTIQIFKDFLLEEKNKDILSSQKELQNYPTYPLNTKIIS